jgi:serine protease Do
MASPTDVQKRLSSLPKSVIVILVVLGCLGMGFVGGLIGSRTALLTGSSSTKVQQNIVLNESQLISSIAKEVGQSVVSIEVTSTGSQTDFFGRDRSISQRSAGTGFIINADGIVITNRHVIPEQATKVAVTLSDGTILDNVSVIGRTSDEDPLDIAFLKINDAKGKKLVPAKLGDSSKVQVGDKVIAIGNALGQFQNTVTEGIISGHGRSVQAGDSSGGEVENLQDLFQTDAAINQGNSGGPLVNINSEVIGINTAVAAGDAQNIGFAIPINDAKGTIDSVLKSGKLERPFLGVRYVSLTDDLADQYDLNVKRGAYIVPSQGGDASIVPDSPAQKSGLKEGDVITKVNNQNVDSSNSLTSLLGQYKVGETVTITIVRDGKTQTVQATLAAAPSD